MKWKVSKIPIKLFPHTNADMLEVGRVGDYQVVIQKGLYEDGDIVVFAPEKSVLTGAIREEFAKYLSGTNHDKVKAARLRGEISCGIIIPPHLLPDLSAFDVGEDVSSVLGITKYKPVIPEELLGAVEDSPIEVYAKHEVYHLGSYRADIKYDERIIASEKIHGTQCICMLDRNDTFAVTSKGLLDEGLTFQSSVDNIYTKAALGIDVKKRLQDLLQKTIESGIEDVLTVQVFGEAYQINKGFSYGRTGDKPGLSIFRVVIVCESGKIDLPIDHPNNVFQDVWAPIVYDGPFNEEGMTAIEAGRKGMEQVSGKSLHKKEGLVIRPYNNTRASDGRYLIVKFLNPKYKETGEELS